MHVCMARRPGLVNNNYQLNMEYSVALTALLLLLLLLPAHGFHSIFNFGDSYSDTGNLFAMSTATGSTADTEADNVPYGETFFGHPTGRESDGRLVLDFIAEAFGLPFVPAFQKKGEDFRHGVNFAVTGATALDVDEILARNVTFLPPFNVSIGVQLKWFESLKPSLCGSNEDCKKYFNGSLFLVGSIGGNDYRDLKAGGIPLEVVEKTVMPKVVATISTSVEWLIEQGAKYLVVPGIAERGCLPSILATSVSNNTSDYDSLGCLNKFNKFAHRHEAMLLDAINLLRRKYPNATIVHAEYARPQRTLLDNPEKYGFRSDGILKACCGGGGAYNYNVNVFCSEMGYSVCKDPLSAVNWDGIHLTETAYKFIAHGWLHGPFAHPPLISLL